MSRTHWIFATLTVFVAGACGGGGDAAPPTEPPPPPPAPTVSLSAATFEVRGIGDSLLVSASATPSGAQVTWSIASPTVATVSARGSSAMLTAVGGGTTTVTVEASSGSQRVSATASVTVVPIVRSVRLDPTAARLLVGGSRQLQVVVQKDAGAIDEVRWTSRSTQLATVSASGLVTGVGAGAAVIVAESVADASKRDSVTLQVAVPVVGGVTISPTTDTLLVGAFRDFVASVTADSGLSSAVTWTSSVPAIASVNANGRVTAVIAGSVIISARSVADPLRVANATVLVRAPGVRELRVTGATTLTAGAQSQYTAQVVADPGVSTAVTWSSSQPGVASVDNTGRVTAIGAGTSKIIARSVATPALADSVLLTVSGPPRFAAWETQHLGVVGGQVEVGTADALVSIDTTGLMVNYGSASFASRTFLWRGDLSTVAPSGVVTTGVYGLSIASDGHITGWQQQPTRIAYRWNGSSFVALPPLPDGAVLQKEPTALPNGRVGAHGRVGGFDRAYVWTGAQWQERFRIAPNVTSGLFAHVVFFGENDILYYEPNVAGNPRNHRILRWVSGNNFDALASMTVEGSFFFIPEFVGRSSFDFFVKLTNSRPLRRYVEGGWIELTLGMAADESVQEVALCPTRVVVATSADRILAIDGAVGVPLGTAADFTQDTYQISCAPDGSLRRSGNNGYVGRWTGTTWRTELQAYAITALRAISSTLAYAGTVDGVIHKWNGAAWSEAFRPAPGSNVGAIGSIAAWPDGRVVATATRLTGVGNGNAGEMRLTTSGGSWTVTQNNIGVGGLWGLNPDEIWGLTSLGHIVRSRNGGTFETMRSDQQYIGLGGRAGSAMIAIGRKLETLRWTGSDWETLSAAVPGVIFGRAPSIWSETDAWAAASTNSDYWANAIYRFNGTAWQPVDMGLLGGSNVTTATYALFSPGPGEVYALHGVYQQMNIPLFHRIDGAWSTIRPLLTRYPLGEFTLTDAAPGIALAVDGRARILMSRPGLTSAISGPPTPVRRRPNPNL